MKNRVEKLRKAKRITQVNLAMRIGVSQQTISNIEHGTSCLTDDNLVKMSKIFGVSVDYILGISEAKRTHEYIMKIGGMSDEEQEILLTYNELGPSDQVMIKAFIQRLLEDRTGL